MIRKRSLVAELKLGRLEFRDGEYFIVELDKKTGEPIDEFALNDILDDFVDKEIAFKMEHVKEL